VSESGTEGKGAVTEGDGEDVDGEPEVTSKNGNERVEGGIEDSGLEVGRDEGEDDDGRGGEEVDGGAVACGEDYRKEASPECHPEDTLIHIGDRRATCDPDAGGKACNEKEKTDPGEERADGEKSGILFLACGKEEEGGQKPSDPG
jgi:hypothetical protein